MVPIQCCLTRCLLACGTVFGELLGLDQAGAGGVVPGSSDSQRGASGCTSGMIVV